MPFHLVAEDTAVDAATQGADPAAVWIAVGLSAFAVLVSLASAWINLRASAPRLNVELDLDKSIATGTIKLKVTNDGDNWVDNIRIKWAADPTGLHAHKTDWRHDTLMPGKSFIAAFSNLPTPKMGSDLETAEQTLFFFGDTIAAPGNGKRRIGRASYKRQTRIPFVRVWQRVILPTPTNDHVEQIRKLFPSP